MPCSIGVQRAVRILEFVLDNEPNNGVALHLRGTIHQQSNNLDAAAASFRQGINLSGVHVLPVKHHWLSGEIGAMNHRWSNNVERGCFCTQSSAMRAKRPMLTSKC